MRAVMVFLVAFSLVGCSHQAMYENLRFNKRNECRKLPPNEYGRCMEGVHRPYDEYEKTRQEVLKK